MSFSSARPDIAALLASLPPTQPLDQPPPPRRRLRPRTLTVGVDGGDSGRMLPQVDSFPPTSQPHSLEPIPASPTSASPRSEESRRLTAFPGEEEEKRPSSSSSQPPVIPRMTLRKPTDPSSPSSPMPLPPPQSASTIASPPPDPLAVGFPMTPEIEAFPTLEDEEGDNRDTRMREEALESVSPLPRRTSRLRALSHLPSSPSPSPSSSPPSSSSLQGRKSPFLAMSGPCPGEPGSRSFFDRVEKSAMHKLKTAAVDSKLRAIERFNPLGIGLGPEMEKEPESPECKEKEKEDEGIKTPEKSSDPPSPLPLDPRAILAPGAAKRGPTAASQGQHSMEWQYLVRQTYYKAKLCAKMMVREGSDEEDTSSTSSSTRRRRASSVSQGHLTTASPHPLTPGSPISSPPISPPPRGHSPSSAGALLMASLEKKEIANGNVYINDPPFPQKTPPLPSNSTFLTTPFPGDEKRSQGQKEEEEEEEEAVVMERPKGRGRRRSEAFTTRPGTWRPYAKDFGVTHALDSPINGTDDVYANAISHDRDSDPSGGSRARRHSSAVVLPPLSQLTG
ncbi:MAG: hypothetical protein DHS80DRAFT_31451 [Piptocephalis tieghemiana]|nr:MAG: hypothetical protein DHS80DRAFT_31451 [Piptocephalis tieghemiana]